MTDIPNPFGGPPLSGLQAMPPGADINEFAIKGVTLELEREVDKRGWDQMHMIWAISRDVTDLPAGGSQGLAMGFGITIVQVLPPEVSNDPAMYLEWLAQSGLMRTHLFADWSDEDLARVQALVFVAEAWGVFNSGSIEGYDPEKRNLHTHPERKECRQVTVVDRAEREYLLLRVRDGGEPRVQVQQHDEHVQGALPDALLAMMRSFQQFA
jgi:hypothetical protein